MVIINLFIIGQKLETQVHDKLVNGQQNVVHSYNEILFSNKEEQTTDAYKNMDESQKSFAKLSQPQIVTHYMIPLISHTGKCKILRTEIRSIFQVNWIIFCSF